MSAYKHRDGYYHMAKKEGYRSRAVYKLKQMDERFNIFKTGDKVVDLGAAPGGWSQYAVEAVGEGNVIALDLERMPDIEGVDFYQGDLRDDETASRIADITGGVDVVLSDMAPKFTGKHTMDQARSLYLAECALEFCDRTLKNGGSFVVKILQGPDFNYFLDKVKNRFKDVKCNSPKASRSSSAEMYIVAKHFTKQHKD